MSSSDRSTSHSSTILRSRYQDLLKGTAPVIIVNVLRDNNLLTEEETEKVLRFENDSAQHRELLDILSCKGIPMLTKYSSAIKKSKRHAGMNVGKAYELSVQVPYTKPPNKSQHEYQGYPDRSLSVGSSHVVNGEGCLSPQAGDECILLASTLGGNSESGPSAIGHDLVGSATLAYE